MTSARATTVSVTALTIGALAVVLAALPYKVFDLDRYFVPKELALHLTALTAAAAMLLAASPPTSPRAKLSLTRTDTLLALFLLASVLSAASAANRWLATRALAVSISGVVLFWVAQHLARLGRARALMAILAAAVTAAAIMTLLQAYGLESQFFSINRSPGGTLGNRNFVAHLGVIGAPTLLLATLRARRTAGVVLGVLATALVAAAIVLSRSRAAWLAIALAGVAVLPLALRAWRTTPSDADRPARESRPAPRGAPSADGHAGARLITRRAVLVGLAALVGVSSAIVLPNALNWKSASPYLDSVLGVANYRGGSGHGRIVQDLNTGRLVLSHPILGVGPGNWAVAYPRVAARNDPSLDPDDGMTANPWPSSDWAAFVSERGPIATACLALAFIGLAVGAWRAAELAIGDHRIDRLLPALALIATVIALIVVATFDAVLLLPTPSLIGWSALGVLAGLLIPAPAARAAIPWTPGARGTMIGVTVLCTGVGAVRSGAQVAAMALYNTAAAGGSQHTLELAARIDPGSYRIRMRLAEVYAEGHVCNRSRVQASAARALYPSAPEPRRLLAACGKRK